MNRSQWNDRLTTENEIRVRAMLALSCLLFQIMVSIKRYDTTDENGIEMEMSKWHPSVHLVLLPLLYGDMMSVMCTTMESYHRWAVTLIFGKTSKRLDSTMKEMAVRTLEHKVRRLDNLARLMNSCDTVEEIYSKLEDCDKPRFNLPDPLFTKAHNCRSCIWTPGLGNPNIYREYMHQKCTVNFDNRMNDFCPYPTRANKTYTIISGVKYDGNTATLYKSGILYCNPRMGRLGNSKYSVIKFHYNNGLYYGVLIGAVMVEEVCPNNNNVISKTIINHVSLMEFSRDRIIPQWWPFERLQHVVDNIVCITHDKIIDHIFVYPDFHPGIISNMDTTNIEHFERYWIIPRQLTERKGTTTVTRDRKDDSDNNIFDFFNSSFANTVENTRIYMRSKQAYGINMNVQSFVNYPTAPNTHSQDNPLPQPQQPRPRINRNNHK